MGGLCQFENVNTFVFMTPIIYIYLSSLTTGIYYLVVHCNIGQNQSPEFKMFSKYQAWSYDQPKVQA